VQGIIRVRIEELSVSEVRNSLYIFPYGGGVEDA